MSIRDTRIVMSWPYKKNSHLWKCKKRIVSVVLKV